MAQGVFMEAEIVEQPTILAANANRYLAELEHLRGPYAMVVLAARGSSDHAALYLRYLIETQLQIPVSLAAPSVITRYGAHLRYPAPSLVIGISQSGAAPDVAEVLAAARESGHATLAITNTPGSRLESVAASTLLLEAGREQSIAATKTFTASLLACYQLVRALGGPLDAPALPSGDWVESCREVASVAQGATLRGVPLFSLARGFRYACAHETALKLMECALLSCKAYSTADFEHGPKALAGHGSTALVFGEPPEGLATQGCEVVTCPVAPVSEALQPLWEIIFGQWLALLAARARGLDPDGARHLRKVTETL